MNTDRVDTFDIEDAELWVACNCHLPDVVKTLFAAIAAIRANQSALPEVTDEDRAILKAVREAVSKPGHGSGEYAKGAKWICGCTLCSIVENARLLGAKP